MQLLAASFWTARNGEDANASRLPSVLATDVGHPGRAFWAVCELLDQFFVNQLNLRNVFGVP